MNTIKRFFFLSLLCLLLSIPSLAVGDGNVDSGAGGMGAGSSQSYWSEDDGIRITVLRTSNVTKVACFDWSNYDASDAFSFVKRSKLDYTHGYSLTPVDETYTSFAPDVPLPTIVGHSGNSIQAIKKYFTGVDAVTEIAHQAGLTYDELISGEYKLLLEPIAYFYYQGIKYAMTATEAALFDPMTNGDLRYQLGRLTHQNLPLALFLERNDPDLHLYRWTGATTGKRSNLDIINYLGMGVISFTEPPPEEEEVEYDYIFRCDTDVIVSFPIYNNSTEDITPDDESTVTLQVGDNTYERSFTCPSGETQLLWVNWHTPSTPQELTMTATGAGTPVTLHVKIESLEEQTPPDPTFYDSGNGFTLEETPDYGSNTSATWGQWEEDWVQEHGIHSNGLFSYTCSGECKEHGYWDFVYTEYQATLNVSYTLSPDDRCQTDYTSAQYGTVMPSGYGVQVEVETTVIRGDGVESTDVTPIQNVVATFPEFDFLSYDRLLEETRTGTWEFKENRYSYYSNRVHFTPLWYPDDTYYTVPICAFDAWTPGGQLYATVSDELYIYLSCLDDWYIHIVE